MTGALGTIEIYKPQYYARTVSGVEQIVRTRYKNPDDGSYAFPVTDSSERSATVMADDYVKLQFKLEKQIVFDAFAYIYYDEQLFFLKEDYRPTSKGSHYEYTMKFVSVANMLDKHLCLRYITVPGQTIDPEPEINMNGTLTEMAAIIMGSISGAADRLQATRPLRELPLFYVYTLKHLTLADDMKEDTALETFSFSGTNISDVLTQVANTYEIEWWITQEGMNAAQLHLCRCENGDTIKVSDVYKQTASKLKPYESRGLNSCEYSQEWSNVPQVIIPFGSERNITRQQALEEVGGSSMYVSYGKQLRLAPNTAYTVTDREGVSHQVTTNALGAFVSAGVKSGIETTKQFDDIYPRCHFRVLSVKVEGTEHPVYTIVTAALKADGTTMSYAEMLAAELLPLQIEPNETLSIVFESGYLNGREFEVHHDIKEVNGTMIWTLTIVPEEGGDDGVSLPFGNFIPHGSDESGFDGDTFAIFHMVMPQGYINQARAELAQAAYDELLAIEDTRPEIKCKTEPAYFANRRIRLGQRVAVYSELFGTLVTDSSDFGLSDESTGIFVSRVTSFQHSLTKPTVIEFKLASARVEGRIASIEAVIADRTSDIRGLEQRSLNLSRRGWHDAAELVNMLQTLAAEMMLVGVEKNQFAFTMAIESKGENTVSNVEHFGRLHISAGYIQHTQEPYIKYANGGKWEVDAVDLTTDINGNSILYDPSDASEPWKKPYYLYAHCVQNATTAGMCLSAASLESDPDYLLLGVLSSEFLDDQASPVTSLRVFNRSNGYTQIAGGTITTEQIQDPTRSLIIDFASNPPRIIAKNGAQIIGKITFLSSDGTKHDLEDTLDDMAEDIEAAQEAADDALEKANNLADDGIISGGTEKSTIKKEWQEIAGSNYDSTSTDGSYYKAKQQAAAYGVSTNTLESKFVALKTMLDAILADMSTDYVLANGNAQWNTKDKFIAKWREYYDAEIALLNLVADTIDQKEVGGENLYTGVDPLTLRVNYGAELSAKVSANKKYVFSVGSKTGKGSILIYVRNGGTTEALATIPSAAQSSFWYAVLSPTVGGTLWLQEKNDTGAEEHTLTQIMVQQGEKPTTYQNSYKYLAEAFEHDATKLTTSIDGGLIVTALLKLINQLGNVTAGISGLSGDNILLWGGATYAQALYAAFNDYLLEAGGNLITTLLKDDGTGKIGCFYIVDKDEVRVKTSTSVIIITNKNIDDVAIIQDSDSEYMDALIRVDDGDASQSGSNAVVSSITFTIAKGGKYNIIVPQTDIESESSVLSYPANPGVYPGQSDAGDASATAYGTFYIRIKNNGTVIHTSSSAHLETENFTDDGQARWWTDTDNASIARIDITKEIAAGNLVVEIVGSYSVSASASTDTSVHASGDARAEISFNIGDVDIVGVERYCVVAKDGMAIIANSNASFYVRNSQNTLQLLAKGLPTTNNNSLQRGQIWNDNGTLKIKT